MHRFPIALLHGCVLLQIASSLTAFDPNQIAYPIPAYSFNAIDGDDVSVQRVSPVIRDDVQANRTSLIRVSAPIFPFDTYIDRCQQADCFGIIFYAVRDLQSILEMTVEGGLARPSFSRPIVALSRTQVDLERLTAVLFSGETGRNRFREAMASRGLIFVMNLVLTHRLFNLVYSIMKLNAFYQARKRAVYSILVVVFYILSSLIGAAIFGSLSFEEFGTIPIRRLFIVIMVDVLVLYLARIAMGINLAQSRARSVTTNDIAWFDRMKDWVTCIGFLLAVAATFVLSFASSLSPGLFTVFLSLIVLPHIVFIAFNARNTAAVVHLLLTNGRKLGLDEQQRKIRVDFAWKAFGATLSGIISMVIQVVFVVLQSQGPFAFLLILSLQSLMMSQIGIYTLAALRPVAASNATTAGPTKEASNNPGQGDRAMSRLGATTTTPGKRTMERSRI